MFYLVVDITFIFRSYD